MEFVTKNSNTDLLVDLKLDRILHIDKDHNPITGILYVIPENSEISITSKAHSLNRIQLAISNGLVGKRYKITVHFTTKLHDHVIKDFYVQVK